MSREIIIADASCLIVLQNIQELDLLQKVFSEVIITDEVKNEFGLDLPAWIKVRRIQNKTQQVTLNLILDNGEASAIALSLEIADALLIIDEKKGRRVAQDLNLKIIGTLGVILLARQKGLIDSIEDFLSRLENVGFRVAPNLKSKIIEDGK